MLTKEQKLVMVTFVFHNKAKMIGSLTPSCTNCDRKEKWEHYIFFNNSTFLHIDFDV